MKRIATLATGIALMVPGTALAESDSSTCQAYNPQLCTITSHSDANSNASANSEGTLPFTGLDVALLAVGGGTLVGAGLVVRRISRQIN